VSFLGFDGGNRKKLRKKTFYFRMGRGKGGLRTPHHWTPPRREPFFQRGSPVSVGGEQKPFQGRVAGVGGWFPGVPLAGPGFVSPWFFWFCGGGVSFVTKQKKKKQWPRSATPQLGRNEILAYVPCWLNWRGSSQNEAPTHLFPVSFSPSVKEQILFWGDPGGNISVLAGEPSWDPKLDFKVGFLGGGRY